MNEELPQKEKTKYFVNNEAELPSDLYIRHDAIDEVVEQMKANQWPEEEYRKLVLPLDEAISNAMKYGNKLDPDKKVKIKLNITSERAVIQIQDQGEGFDWRNVPNPTAEENKLEDHGRGIWLMRQFFDHVVFNNKGNKVTLTKNRK